MVDYYVEPAGNDGNLGTAPGAGNAWLTIEHALEAGALAAGDNVWVRRTHNEVPVTDILPIYDGAADSPISIIGWPRDEVTGTATFTNGSTSVTAVSIAGDREQHQGRRIKCDADGEWYLITRVVDADTFTIDREYQGTTAAATNFTIQKDDDFDTRPVAGQAPWDGDAHDLPIIDFNDGNLQLQIADDNYHVFKNIEFKDSTDSYGIIYVSRSGGTSFIGCLIKQSLQNDPLLRIGDTSVYMERVIMEGSGAGAAQNGIMTGKVFCGHLKDCALYNLGGHGIYEPTHVYLENVNIGVEIANANDDIAFDSHGTDCFGRDVWLGGTNGDVDLAVLSRTPICAKVHFENYGKVLGAHKAWFLGGSWQKVTAGSGGTVPNQRAGGATYLIEITPDVANYEFIPNWAVKVFSHEFEVDTTQRTWRYYIQNDACSALGPTDLWIALEYIKKRDDDTEYVMDTVLSDETVNNRADANDWTQYIEVPTITPAVASKVRIKCYVSKHSAAGHIYIDPKVSNP